MAYTTNPHLPKLRAKACKMIVSEGKSIREVARYIGVSPGAVSKWMKKYPTCGASIIPTDSSRPHTHPATVDEKIVERIVEIRKQRRRCAEVIHKQLLNEGMKISLSTVKRTLNRKCLTKKKSPWKKYHKNFRRPKVALPGDLVQMDTVHLMTTPKKRIYVYTLIDLYSRWSYARATDKIGAYKTVSFVKDAQKLFPYPFTTLQSDHGPEFSQRFTDRMGIAHRHSRVRKPNDNAHIERFNRTIQEELISDIPCTVRKINIALPEYLKYYNTQRLHMGINLKTPMQILDNLP